MSTNTPTGFSLEEIQASVGNLVVSSIEKPTDPLGVRRVDVTFDIVQEATAGVFLLHSKAPFYVLRLAAQRLQEVLDGQVLIVQQVLDALQATGRTVLPVNDLTALNNAAAALFELESAVGLRSSSFTNINNVPSFQRFQTNVSSFLSTAGSNVKENGQIVMTPQEARILLPSLLKDLKSSQEELIRRASLIQNGVADYNGVNLPALVASGVISRGREQISALADALAAKDPTGRLEDLREAVLNLLSTKAVVQQFGQFAAQSRELTISGSGQPYSDATHLAENAETSIGLALPGPFDVTTSQNVLDLFLNRSLPVTSKVSSTFTAVTTTGNINEALFSKSAFNFPGAGVIPTDVVYVRSGPNNNSRWVITAVTATTLTATGVSSPIPDSGFIAEVFSAPEASITLANAQVPEIRSIRDDKYYVTTSADHELRIAISNSSPAGSVAVSLTVGVLTAEDLASQINAVVGPLSFNLVAVPFYQLNRFSGQILVTNLTVSSARIALPIGNFPSAIQVGDEVFISQGPNANTRSVITALGPSSSYLDVNQGLTTDATLRLADVGNSRRVKLVAADPVTALENRTSIQILDSSNSNGTAQILGFIPGFSSVARPVTAKDVATDLSAKTTLAGARAQFSPSFTGSAKTQVLFPTRVTVFKISGLGNVDPSGPDLLLTLPAGGFIQAGVQVGDKIVLRSSNLAGGVWTVSAVSDTQLTASGPPSSTQTNVQFDVGPNLSSAEYGQVLKALAGPNVGEYYVKGPSTWGVPIEIEMQNAMPLLSLVGQPVVFTAQFGDEFASFFSKDQTVASTILVDGPARKLFFPFSPIEGRQAVAQSPWFLLPEVPRELEVDDLLDVFVTDYSTPTQSFDITSIDSEIRVLGVSPAYSLSLPSPITFEVEALPPFARLRAAKVVDFETFQGLLQGWLARPENQTSYFTDLNRLVNPLLSNQNPTQQQVKAAMDRVMDLAEHLNRSYAELASAVPEDSLEAILASYQVDPVGPVDTLIAAFGEKGADRALDLLLEGQFSVFFGLSMDESSYAGDLMTKIRDVAREDLPIRKTNRAETAKSRLLGSFDSEDFEFSGASDLNENLMPDPPVT